MMTNINQELTAGMVKGLLESDLLHENTTRMRNIRVSIIHDRNYSVPEWFHEYIQSEDIERLITKFVINELTDNISDEAKRFIQFHSDKGTITDSSYSTIVSFMIHRRNYDLIGYMDIYNTYKYLKSFIDDIDEDSIVKCIDNICTVKGILPKRYIYLYLTKSVSKHWYFSNRDNLRDALVKLIRGVSYDNRDLVYSTIYKSHITDMDKSLLRYSDYILHYDGTWFKPTVNIMNVIDYIVRYNFSTGNKHIKPMDDTLVDYLRNYVDYIKKDKETYTQNIRHLKELLIKSLSRNPDNIKFLHAVVRNDTTEKVNIVLPKDWHVEELDTAIKLTNSMYHYNILMQYVERGNDIRKIIPYIDMIANNENIYTFISRITPDRLAILADENPIIYDRARLTLIDVIMSNRHKFTTGMMDTIRMAFIKSGKIYSTLSLTERAELYFKSNDISTICAKFPDLVKYADGISFADVSIMYKVNPDIVHYVSPSLIPNSTITHHIRMNGYTSIRDIQWFGFENIMGIHDYMELLKVGKGIGHLLDFSNVGYRNAILQKLIEM